MFVLKVDISALDSFGFEKDLKVYTAGQAFETMQFDYWEMAPGDPLDHTTKLKLLEPSASLMLVRDIMIRTRRRKDLTIGVMGCWETLW